MQGQRYPITELGLEVLLAKLIERGERDKSHGECQVSFTPGAKVSNRSAPSSGGTPTASTSFRLPHRSDFIDDEYQLPVRYAAFLWPRRRWRA